MKEKAQVPDGTYARQISGSFPAARIVGALPRSEGYSCCRLFSFIVLLYALLCEVPLECAPLHPSHIYVTDVTQQRESLLFCRGRGGGRPGSAFPCEEGKRTPSLEQCAGEWTRERVRHTRYRRDPDTSRSRSVRRSSRLPGKASGLRRAAAEVILVDSASPAPSRQPKASNSTRRLGFATGSRAGGVPCLRRPCLRSSASRSNHNEKKKKKERKRQPRPRKRACVGWNHDGRSLLGVPGHP